ncbi:Small ubiquitin-related modifier, SUMO [Artemisia annua]|uniref:Small ubiquitin-related modifier, SUMO n=1 Tax=Artemisia annua TaxID=35608 RepID=A0A2U1PXP6_ARTAN|nr:Small ubiquitin-related modifier, SUMO [Artemisia annua]
MSSHTVKQEVSSGDSANLYITIKVVSQINELDPYFRVRRDEPLKQLMIRWCARSGVGDYKIIRFLDPEGTKIDENKTADELELQDGDCIDAWMDQTAG